MSLNTPPSHGIAPLLRIMALLRNKETGCPWDLKQSFSTISPYTIEEAYEVADAIARDDMAALKEELGDLLFQVAFHSRMAEEIDQFNFEDVVQDICAKMIRRHPHVFGDADQPDWEMLKAEERAEKSGAGALAGVALSLPALLRAEKLQRRAARTGFDWPEEDGAKAKIYEEIKEVETATSETLREEEVGDLLFAVVNWARHLGIEPENALRRANAKFEKRFLAMEEIAGPAFASLSLEEKEELWAQAKRA